MEREGGRRVGRKAQGKLGSDGVREGESRGFFEELKEGRNKTANVLLVVEEDSVGIQPYHSYRIYCLERSKDDRSTTVRDQISFRLRQQPLARGN